MSIKAIFFDIDGNVHSGLSCLAVYRGVGHAAVFLVGHEPDRVHNAFWRFAPGMEYIGHFKIIFALRHADSGESRRFSDMFKAGGVGKGYGVVFI